MADIFQINKQSPVNAMWGDFLLFPPGKAYGKASAGIWDGVFNYTAELDAEQLETTEAQNPIDTKGGDKQKEFAIRVEANKYATGQNPLSIYKRWIEALGQAARFYIGLAPIDGSRYILQRVNLDFGKEDIAADGSPFRVFIDLEFIENTILRKSSNGVEDKEENGEKTNKKTASKVGAKKAEKKAEAGVYGDTYKPKTTKTKKSDKKSVFE